jgi:predicted site-specific integrase-resolvase
MRINELADRLGITPRAIRLYEQKGLLRPERTPDNGYRSYSEEDSWRLQTIASLREIGLSIYWRSSTKVTRLRFIIIWKYSGWLSQPNG